MNYYFYLKCKIKIIIKKSELNFKMTEIDDTLETPLISQPLKIKISLFNHQLTSIYNMENLEKSERILMKPYSIRTKVGFLSDLLGYGKTLSILGLIARDNMPWDINYPYITREPTGTMYIKCEELEMYKKLNVNLVVLPSILVSQWEKELEKTMLNFATICKANHAEIIDPKNYEIILCDQRFYNDLTARFSKYAWKRIIFDEPSMSKMNLRTSMTGFYWFLTYTYSDFFMKKKGKFFNEIFGNLDTTILENIVVKNNDDYVKTSFKMPETKHFRYTCYEPLISVLNGIISDTVIELISAGNFDKAIKALGGDKDNKNIINLIIKKKFQKIQKYTDNEDKKKLLQSEITELEKRFNLFLSSECPICLEKMLDPTLVAECHHFFCNKCIHESLKINPCCPLCRTELYKEKFITYSTSENNYRNAFHCRTKQEIITDIINNRKESDKFIIFSNHDETFNKLKLFLNVKYGDLKGKSEQKEKTLREFKTGEIKVLFLNAKESGAGLNLQETTDIILYHKMKEETEVQIIGRANRIGRKQPLKIHYLN
jgi:hypothetical protein